MSPCCWFGGSASSQYALPVSHVIDFIAYANVFVGNVADIAIVTAAGLVVLQALRGVRLDGMRERAEPKPEAPGVDD